MSSSSYHSASPETPTHCQCGIPVANKQSWTPRNPGRRFVGCKFYNPATGWKGCGSFAWIDNQQEEWQRVLINQLILEKQLLGKQLDHLKEIVCALEDQNSKVLKENDKLKTKNIQKTNKKPKKKNVNWIMSIVVGVFVASLCCLFGFANVKLNSV